MAEVNLTISSGVTIDVDIGTGNVASQYKYFTENRTEYRQGVRNAKFVLDKALTDLGFNGAEGIDWENLTESE